PIFSLVVSISGHVLQLNVLHSKDRTCSLHDPWSLPLSTSVQPTAHEPKILVERMERRNVLLSKPHRSKCEAQEQPVPFAGGGNVHAVSHNPVGSGVLQVAAVH